MSKNIKINKEGNTDLQNEIMTKISSGQISMRPKWYFVVGSLLGIFSLTGLTIGVVYFVNIVFFLLRKHGPMGQWRFDTMVNNFPWWIPVVAIVGIIVSVWLLKKYDFSYKKNFPLIVVGFILSIIIAAIMIDNFGFNEKWSKRGPMRRFYQQLETREEFSPGNLRGKENGQRKGKFF